MNQYEFLKNTIANDFIDFFGTKLGNWPASYKSRNTRIPAGSRRFSCQNVEQALESYCWPAHFTAPAEDRGASISASERVVSCDWPTTKRVLNYLARGLQGAIASAANADHATLMWAKAILDWGMGSRGKSALTFLAGVAGGPAAYLSRTADLLQLDKVDLSELTQRNIPYMNSGLGKLHSLATSDGLVIFDSRVAAALCQAINEYLLASGQSGIPESLQLMRVGASERTSVPVGGHNHPLFQRDFRWMNAQVRVSWLLRAVLERTPDVFPGDDLALRVHKLEAALFMIGAKLSHV